MKLLKCHITGFGRFSSREIEFLPHVNCFCFENGAGKTTLAAFIKAMFYGLPTARANSGRLNDREHFMPFDRSGGFGGSVEFEYNGAVYRIEREFDGKSETADRKTVYRNGAKCDGFKDFPTLGEQLFGVDAESFERTVFWGAGDLYTGSIDGTTPGISAALGRGAEAGIEGKQLARALAIADSKIVSLQGKKKKSAGLIPECQRRLYEISADLSMISAEEDKAAKLYERRAELILLSEETEKELALSRRAATAAEEKKIYGGYVSAASASAEKAAQINGKYRRGIPPLRTAEMIDAALRRISAADGALSAAGISTSGDEELARLEAVYPNGIPSEADSRRLSELEQKAAAVAGDESVASSPFANGGGEETLARVKELLTARDSAAAELKKIGELPKAKPPKAAIIAAIPSAIFAAAYAIAAFVPFLRNFKRVFLAVAAIFGVLFAVSIIAAWRFLKRSQAERMEKAARLKTEKEENESAASAILASFGFASGNVDADRILFEKGLESFNKARAELDAKRGKNVEAAAGIAEILGRYGLPDDGSFTGERIRNDLYLMQSLKAAKKENDERGDAASRGKSEAVEFLRSVFEIAGLDDPDPATAANVADEIRTDSALFASAERSAEEETRKAEEYLAAHPDVVAEFPDGLRDPETIEAELSELRKDAARTDAEICSSERIIADKPVKQEELDETKAELAALTEKRDLLTAVAGALEKANASLNERFTAPVRGVFERHAAAVEAALGASLGISDKLRITFESGGKYRDTRHLSSGQRAVAAICFRTAICDSVYPNEKPFLILDDPFESLDARHMSGAADLIRELANEYQIIYFCAHESRKIGGRE